jgi:hypothetical protein
MIAKIRKIGGNLPAGSADPVEIRFRHLGEIKVDHHVHGLDVDT